MLPEALRHAVEDALSDSGDAPLEIRSAHPLGGGSIHRALRLDTSRGSIFLKWNRGMAAAGFGCEARSLERLREVAESPGVLRIPRVLGWRDSEDDPESETMGWLALEYLPPSSPGPGYGQDLGRGLAAVHRQVQDRPGWPEDNLIGPLPQANPPGLSWSDFWRDARLEPQVRRARDAGYFTGGAGRTLDEALDAVERVLEPVTEGSDQPASLLHGDLWGGNVHPGPDGRPVLVDPASYHGHREVDLAMSELFGGFPPEFLPAYREAWPLREGYAEVRRALYQLYYLLVHVNLFGGGYVGSSLQAARRVAERA